MLRKGKSAVEGDPKKSWSGIEMEVGLEVSLVGIHREEASLTFARIERKTPVLRSALHPNQSSWCGLHRSGDRGGGGPNGQVVSVKRAADGRRQRGQKIINEKREKYRAKNESLWNTLTDSKGTTFVILINHASAPIRKIESDKQSKEGGQPNRFVEKGGVPDRVESFEKVDSSENCPRARPGFIKLIGNGLRNEQNLI